MSYLDTLSKEASATRTLNGARTYSTSSDACLDLFAVAGGMRGKREQELVRLFDRAYIENPELAMKLLFYIRDIRGGLGEREIFRTLIRHVAKTWRDSARKNVALIAEYGRYDDLLCLMGTPAQKEVVRVISAQLEKDKKALAAREQSCTEEGRGAQASCGAQTQAGAQAQAQGDAQAQESASAHISLLAKWMPSINASSARTRGQAKVMARALGLKEVEYRKLLAGLRAAISLTECRLTSRKVDNVNYETVPAGALLKYRAAFERHDGERFGDYLTEAIMDEKKIHCDTLYPYELVRPFINAMPHSWFRTYTPQEVPGEDILDLMWDRMGAEVAGQNAIAVIDTSGSMYCTWGGHLMPAVVSQSLGLYFAERCKGTFHNRFITFESQPHLIEVHGATLRDKLRYIQSAPWGGSTNLEAVFDLILRTAIEERAPQEDMPATLYIISDMEFNVAMRDPDKSVYENAKTKFEAHGYAMPAVVFQNVNSWQMQTPVRAHTKGTALASGAGTNNFKYKFDGNITPMDHMLRVLNGPRYAAVHA